MTSRRIVLATFGSLGDLHPYIALGQGLRERGHQPVIAGTPIFQKRVEQAGIEFAPVRPDLSDLGGDEFEIMRKASNPRNGTAYVVRDLAMPMVRQSYDDLEKACAGADLLISHPLTYAAPILAEKTGMPWASSVLQPMVLLSAIDPPSAVRGLRWMGPTLLRKFYWLPKFFSRSWLAPLRQLRRELGLPVANGHPIFEGQFSPRLNLALFSPHFAPPQADWPANTTTTGFLVFDRNEEGGGMEPELRDFVMSGPPPAVFTLGSSAVMAAGDFYRVSAEIAKRLGVRAVLLIGKDERNRPDNVPDSIFVANYAPYSELFQHASLVVHQGGVGTTAQVLRAGVPMLVVPFAHDQPDNAARITRLGVGRGLPIGKYRLPRALGEVRRILETPRYAERATALGEVIRKEDGVAKACAAILSVL